MTNEKIIELAKQAGFWEPVELPSDWEYGDYVGSPREFQRFAELVRNEVLEKAAESYDQKAVDAPTNAETFSAIHIANELRSMKK